MNPTYSSYLESPIGCIEIAADDRSILSVSFLEDRLGLLENKENEISRAAKLQLTEYFSGNRTHFELHLNFSGTAFQQKVWSRLLTIPFGKTMSYIQLAVALGDVNCIRAAASANGKNPFAIVVPCHRVIGKDGSLTGYAGGLWRKQWLLEHENSAPKQTTLF